MAWTATIIFKTYLVQRTSDGVALGVADGGMLLRSGQAGEEDDDGVGEHVGGV